MCATMEIDHTEAKYFAWREREREIQSLNRSTSLEQKQTLIKPQPRAPGHAITQHSSLVHFYQ